MTQDLGRHLINGQIILETHKIPKTNFFSYTYSDFPFINHHWFSEVIFYFLVKLGGFNLLLISITAIAIVAFALVVFHSLKKANIISLVIVSILYLLVLFERTEVRPEIFSFFFVSVFIVILYRYREKFTPLIFILPLIELLWVNIHIYFPIGIAVLGLFLIDSVIINRKRPLCKYTIILSSVLIASSLLSLINPNGMNGALYPFRVFQNYGYTIEENQNVFFLWNYFNGKATILFFFISSALLFLTLVFSWKKTRLIDWLLAIFFTILGASAERNFPLFVFGTFPAFVYSLSPLSEKLLHSYKIKRIILAILAILLIWQIINVISSKPIGFGVEKGAEPAVDFLIKNKIKGPIFNNFDIGSYLEYRLYPKEKVFVDGRPEAYPASFFQNEYIAMQENKEVFKKISEKYNFQTIFFAHTDQTPWAEKFMRSVVNDPEWQLIYADDFVMILIKNKKENLPDYLHVPSFQTLDMKSLFRLAHFLNTVGFADQEISIYQAILAKDPDSCPSLYNLSLILEQKQSPLSSVYASRFNRSCK